MDYTERSGTYRGFHVTKSLADLIRSSSASHRAYYGHSYSAAGGTGTDQPSSAGTALAQRYGVGGGASTTGKCQMPSRG